MKDMLRMQDAWINEAMICAWDMHTITYYRDSPKLLVILID
jgi:hypothetical protein